MRSWAGTQTSAWTLKPATAAQRRPDGKAASSKSTASPTRATRLPARGPVATRPDTEAPWSSASSGWLCRRASASSGSTCGPRLRRYIALRKSHRQDGGGAGQIVRSGLVHLQGRRVLPRRFRRDRGMGGPLPGYRRPGLCPESGRHSTIEGISIACGGRLHREMTRAAFQGLNALEVKPYAADMGFRTLRPEPAARQATTACIRERGGGRY